MLVLGNLVASGFSVFVTGGREVAGIEICDSTKLLQYDEFHRSPNDRIAQCGRKRFFAYDALWNAGDLACCGWRGTARAGEAIGVDQRGTRQTCRREQVSPERTIALVSGSFSWCTGIDSDRAIPSEANGSCSLAGSREAWWGRTR